MRIAIEAGGTFTDLVADDGDGNIASLKVPSTPAAPQRAILAALDALGWPLDQVDVLLHGSTVATNALLERKGAATVLITTRGFRDLLAMGRHYKESIYDLGYRRPCPLVPTDNVLLADERVSARGELVRPVANLAQIVADLIARHRRSALDAVAVALINSHRNAANEVALRDAIAAALPGVPVILSSTIAPQLGEYERASTAAISAFVGPVVADYLGGLANDLVRRRLRGPLYIMQSNGGTAAVDTVISNAATMLLSGPAAGVVGAAAMAADSGHRDLITFDIGGTSTDVCVVQSGKPRLSAQTVIAGYPVLLPMVDVLTVGAGGGSIASRDAAGILTLGPQSAGAVPGPAAFGKGGVEPTVTDAFVACGILREGRIFGGGVSLDRAAAIGAIARIALPGDDDVVQLADDICRLANANMAQAVRLITVERGVDPRDLTLVAYGGGGGLHACAIAEDLGMGCVLIPPLAGLMSAYGLLASNLRSDGSASILESLDDIEITVLEAGFDRLVGQVKPEGVEALEVSRALDLRYFGQTNYLTVPFQSSDRGEIRAAFEAAYCREFGHVRKGGQVEIVNQRVSVSAAGERPVVAAPASGVGATFKEAEIFHDGGRQRFRIYERSTLAAGSVHAGPILVEDATSTTIVPRDWTMRVEPGGNLILRYEGGAAN